jgi:hypothetical protein
MMHSPTKKMAAIAVLAVAAIAVPSASASAEPTPYPVPAGVIAGFGPTNANHRPTPATGEPDVPTTPTVAAPSTGFDWGDAGIGAAGALSLLGIGAGAVVIARRSRRSQPLTS